MADVELRHESTTRASIFANSFEVGMAALFVLTGIALIQTKFHVHLTVTQEAPRALVASWATELLVGGAAVIVGLLVPGGGRVARVIEVAGLWLAMSAWLTYLVTLAMLAPHSTWLTFGQPIVCALGCAGRLWTLHRLDRALVRLGVAISRFGDDDEGAP